MSYVFHAASGFPPAAGRVPRRRERALDTDRAVEKRSPAATRGRTDVYTDSIRIRDYTDPIRITSHSCYYSTGPSTGINAFRSASIRISSVSSSSEERDLSLVIPPVVVVVEERNRQTD